MKSNGKVSNCCWTVALSILVLVAPLNVWANNHPAGMYWTHRVREEIARMVKNDDYAFISSCTVRLRSGRYNASVIFPVGRFKGLFVFSNRKLRVLNTGSIKLGGNKHWNSADFEGGVYTIRAMTHLLGQLLELPFTWTAPKNIINVVKVTPQNTCVLREGKKVRFRRGLVTVLNAKDDAAVKAIPVGRYPRAMTLDPDGNKLYVTNGGSDTVSVINLSTGTVMSTIPVGKSPRAIVSDLQRKHVYVVNGDSNSLSVIDTTSDTVVGSVYVGSTPRTILISHTGRLIYVTSIDGSVSVIDAVTDKVIKTIPVGRYPRAMALSPRGHKLYVVNEFSNDVSVIDTATDTVVATVQVASEPLAIAPDPRNHKTYVISEMPGVTILSRNDTTIKKMLLMNHPKYMVFGKVDHRLYIANGFGDSVSVIDAATDKVLRTIPVGRYPRAMALSPRGHKLYVVNEFSNDVSVIDTTTDSILGTIPVGIFPRVITINPNTYDIYVISSRKLHG